MTTLEVAQRNYEENIRRIPWTVAYAKQVNDAIRSNNNILNTNLPVYVNNVEQEVRGVSGVKERRENAKASVNSAILTLQGISNMIDDNLNKIDIGGIQNKINVVEEQIKAEREKQNKSQELLSIRKEQSVALEQKYAANLHSSWLGLWRPLKDTTHVGLNVASVVFGLLALLTIGYMVYTTFVTPALGGGSTEQVSNNILAGLTGGFRKGKRV
jgi:hypothetical protein